MSQGVCQVFGSGCKTGTLFTSPTSTFGNGTNSNRATAGADAQYGSNETWDYYKNVHGRNGIGNDGKGSYNRVHYGNSYNNENDRWRDDRWHDDRWDDRAQNINEREARAPTGE